MGIGINLIKDSIQEVRLFSGLDGFTLDSLELGSFLEKFRQKLPVHITAAKLRNVSFSPELDASLKFFGSAFLSA